MVPSAEQAAGPAGTGTSSVCPQISPQLLGFQATGTRCVWCYWAAPQLAPGQRAHQLLGLQQPAQNKHFTIPRAVTSQSITYTKKPRKKNKPKNVDRQAQILKQSQGWEIITWPKYCTSYFWKHKLKKWIGFSVLSFSLFPVQKEALGSVTSTGHTAALNAGH